MSKKKKRKNSGGGAFGGGSSKPRPQSERSLSRAGQGPSPDFLAEKDKFMRLLGEQMEQQDFASEEEAQAFLNSFVGRPMGEVIEEYEQGEESAQERALNILESTSPQASESTLRQAAKRALEVCPECFASRLMLAQNYRQPAKAEKVFREGVDLGYQILAEYLPAEDEVGHSWGWMEVRPFLNFMSEWGFFLWKQERFQEGDEVLLEILRLNRGDNQGLRGPLLMSLLAEGNFSKAEEVLGWFEDDALLSTELARALLPLCRFVSKWPTKVKKDFELAELVTENLWTMAREEEPGIEEQIRKLEARNPMISATVFNPHALDFLESKSYRSVRMGGILEALEAAADSVMIIREDENIPVAILWHSFPWTPLPIDLYEDYPEDREIFLELSEYLLEMEGK